MTDNNNAQAEQNISTLTSTTKKSTAKKSTTRKSTAASTKKKTTSRKKKTSTTSLESAIRREITKQTGIPTTASGIKNKIGRAIVDGIIGLFTSKKSSSRSSKKGDIVADI